MIKSPMWTGQPYKWIHGKLDGITLTITNVSGQLRCWTNRPTNLTEQLKSCGWMLPLVKLPQMTTLYGELWLPGFPASQVKSALAKSPEALQFSGFAIDKPFPEQASLGSVNDRLLSWGIRPVDYLRCHIEDPRLLLNDLPPDLEGYMLKSGNLYEWYKLKPEKTIDLIVTGVRPGKGKYSGQVGALICSTSEGYEVANVGGMTDAERLHMTIHSPIGKVIELIYQYVGSRGRLRHPRFKRFRDDKTSCFANQDPDLRKKWNAIL